MPPQSLPGEPLIESNRLLNESSRRIGGASEGPPPIEAAAEAAAAPSTASTVVSIPVFLPALSRRSSTEEG